MNRASARSGLLFVIALSACEGADTGGPTAGRSVTIDLRALQAPPAGSAQTDCVSAIAEAVLRVGPTARERRIPVPAGASSITFADIDVEQGMVAFSVSIASDNGTELYGKDTTARIDAATFSIALVAEKRGPVLQVCPGHITLDRAGIFQDTLEVINRGIGKLTYEAESPDCPGGPCMSLVPRAGTVAAGVTGRVVDSLIRMAPVASVEMRVRSPVGSVPIAVTLGPLPDVVVAEFATTGAISFNQELNQLELPVTVTLRNDGNTPANVFKVAAEYTDTLGSTFFRAFAVPGGDGFYAFTADPLAPGGTVTLAGSVLWPDFTSNQLVRLRMEGDSCSGDELFETFCRVDEFSEFNNFSPDITVTIPAFPIP